MYKLVLIRHGQSQWNLDNRFSGWADVDLTDQGMALQLHCLDKKHEQSGQTMKLEWRA